MSTDRKLPRLKAVIPDGEAFRSLTSCRAACPVQTDARGYVKAIARGDFVRAYQIARAPNPLASICGRICGAPCEVACRRSVIDDPIAIRVLKRAAQERTHADEPFDAARTARWIKSAYGGSQPIDAPRDPGRKRNFDRMSETRVAIVGSGPAGLAAAHDLALLGASVTIFEAEPIAGGMLALGIPAYRLQREIIRFEIDVIRHLGVDFRCGIHIGRDLTLPELRREFDAVVLAIGAKSSRRLALPGSDLPGVIGGVDFLRDVSLNRKLVVGSSAVVIGGGNVAFDVARSVIRQTQLDVAIMAARRRPGSRTTVVCLEERKDMPADHAEIMEGEEEGIHLINGMGPEAFLADDSGKVRAVRFREVTRLLDDQGKFAPLFGERRIEVPCDTVLMAVGQLPDLKLIDPSRDGIELGHRGLPILDEELRTTAPDVWCAGDLAHGLKLAIHAIASGKQAARSIYRARTGKGVLPQTLDLHIPIEHFERERDYDLRQRIRLPNLPLEERLAAQNARVEASVTDEQALFEASRCLDCGIHTIIDGDKCVLCGGCVDICPEACFKIVTPRRVDLPPTQQQVVDNRLNGHPGALILKDETACTRCGLCATRCPASAITLERHEIEEVAS
jgi:formate dehydrogenase (NADP+) beta subunit